jgi:uncharacterized membrane protein
MEKHRRSLAKTITWGIIASLTTTFIVFIFTYNVALSLGIGMSDVMMKVFFYYGHERIWNKIRWGRG